MSDVDVDGGPPGLPEGEMHMVAMRTDRVVVLDLVDDLPREQTPYCVHGQTGCHRCHRWCWLGHNSLADVLNGRAAPVCRPCANELLEDGATPVGNAADHLRADGPHE